MCAAIAQLHIVFVLIYTLYKIVGCVVIWRHTVEKKIIQQKKNTIAEVVSSGKATARRLPHVIHKSRVEVTIILATICVFSMMALYRCAAHVSICYWWEISSMGDFISAVEPWNYLNKAHCFFPCFRAQAFGMPMLESGFVCCFFNSNFIYHNIY